MLLSFKVEKSRAMTIQRQTKQTHVTLYFHWLSWSWVGFTCFQRFNSFAIAFPSFIHSIEILGRWCRSDGSAAAQLLIPHRTRRRCSFKIDDT